MLEHNLALRLARCRRCIEDGRSTRFGITLITISIIFLGLGPARGKTDPEADSRHRVLAKSLGRGQLTVDLFPPLSYFLRTSSPAWALSLVDHACRQIMVYMVIWDSAMDSSCGTKRPFSFQRRGWAVLIMVWLGILLSRNGNPTLQSGSPLEVSSSLAACLVLLALMPRLTPGWAGQILVIVAGALGCNTIDWVLCYAVITARTLTRTALDAPLICSLSSSSRPFSAARLACHLAFALIRAVCLPLLVSLSVYALFPYSETSGGGNYNLHFLDSTSRRALYQLEPITLSSLGLSKHGKHIPKHALIPYLPLSLYVPNAGFLWADPDEPEAEDPAETQNGVFFSDPFGTRYPWALEEPTTPGDQLDKDELEFVQSHVWPGALVYLRSRIDGRYLGTVEDQNSTSSDEMLDKDGNDEQDGLFKRLWVGMHAKKSAASVWILEHDPERDAGFRLYNPHKECYLATTFRKSGLTKNNGIVEEDFHGTYEASCTRVVSKSASTIWAIEGNLVHDSSQTPGSAARVLAVWKSLSGRFRRAISISNAHASLFKWQRLYGQKLDMPPSPLSFSRLRNPWGLWFERLTFGGFLAMHALCILVRQRTGRKSGIDWHVVSPAALLCWGHVLFHNVFTYARPYGAEVVLVISLRGLWHLLSESIE